MQALRRRTEAVEEKARTIVAQLEVIHSMGIVAIAGNGATEDTNALQKGERVRQTLHLTILEGKPKEQKERIAAQRMEAWER